MLSVLRSAGSNPLAWLLILVVVLLLASGVFLGVERLGIDTTAYGATVESKHISTSGDAEGGSSDTYYVTVSTGRPPKEVLCSVPYKTYQEVQAGKKVIVYLGQGRITGRTHCDELVPSERL